MDPSFFTPEDIRIQKCMKCGADIEFWKDDVFLACRRCGARNTNVRLEKTCLAWCGKASACIGNRELAEWLITRQGR